MIRSLIVWIEHRTSLKKVVDALLLEHIPGGAKWRYVWGSCLSFVFALQMLTGILLMTAYSPSNTSAWGSVYFIQYEMDFGWLIRGMHHFGSQAMVVLLFLHMLQVVIAGAQLPPREVNWWLGLMLMGVVLALGLTGYLLPWDQKGYWATGVATNIMSGTPVIGTWLKNIIIGGTDYGNHTLTRFFALHVAILPALLVLILVAHLALFRRHGITYPSYPKKLEKDGWFWPDQVFRDMIACLVVLGVILFLVLNGHGYPVPGQGHGHAAPAEDEDFYNHWAKAGQRGLGANLDAPADPETQYDPRPEWYYLFLFQLLKYFPGEQIMIGTQVIPGAVALVLFLLPLFGFGKMRPIGHILGVVVVVSLIAAICSLTCLALAQDTPDEIPHALLNRLALLIIPAVAGIYLMHLAIAAMLGPGTMRKLLVPLGLLIVAVLMAGTGGLVYAALNNKVPEPVAELIKKKIAEEERGTPEHAKEFKKALEQAKDFQGMVKDAEEQATRAIELAYTGNVPVFMPGNIPITGAVELLRKDPKTRFKPLFLKHCAACHSYADDRVVEFDPKSAWQPLFLIRKIKDFKDAKYSASDLAGFGTQEWISSFLKNPGSKRFYGRILDPSGAPVFESMQKFVAREFKNALKEKGEAGVAEVEADFAKIASWLATHPTGTDFKQPEDKVGYTLFKEKYNCVKCHRYENVHSSTASAPDLTGYGGPLWLHKMIRSPGHPDLYGANNVQEFMLPNGLKVVKSLMPSFFPANNVQAELQRKDYELLLKKTIDVKNVEFADLSDIDRELLVRGLTGDYRLVFGGQEITAIEKKEKK